VILAVLQIRCVSHRLRGKVLAPREAGREVDLACTYNACGACRRQNDVTGSRAAAACGGRPRAERDLALGWIGEPLRRVLA
jgi:hypothetical protein